ncbi:MAG: DUF1588 domain-containing protein [Myxococcaceae bacterium]
MITLAGCTGRISEWMNPGGAGGGGSAAGSGAGGSNGAGGGAATAYDPSFACDPNGTAISATPIRRLSKAQWAASLNAFFSPLTSAQRASIFAAVQPQLDLVPADSNAFSARSDTLVTQAHVDATFEVAVALAQAVNADDAMVAKMVKVCGSGSTRASLSDSTCLTQVVDYFGHKAFRRPLTSAEEADFVSFYGSLGADGFTGLIARLLLHPDFYYELDFDGALVSGTEGVDATYQLSDEERLNKLTFLFWEAPADDATLAAANGKDLEAVLDLVLDDPRAQTGLATFYKTWLQLDQMPGIPSMETPAFDAFATGLNIGVSGHDLRADMIQEVVDLGLFYTLTTGGRYEDLLESNYSFARSSDLAGIYGVAPWDGTAQNLVPFMPGERSGLLSRGAMLVSGSEITRPIIKGKKVRMQVLCDELSPPPASLMIKPLTPDPSKTQRQIVETATASSTCQACHGQMNPIGFASEGFDALGRKRTLELKLDAQGNVVNQLAVSTASAPVITGALDPTMTKDIVELAQKIDQSGKGQRCFVQQTFRFTYGRKEAGADACDLESMRQKLTAQGGSLKEMFKELVRRDSFLERKIQ